MIVGEFFRNKSFSVELAKTKENHFKIFDMKYINIYRLFFLKKIFLLYFNTIFVSVTTLLKETGIAMP